MFIGPYQDVVVYMSVSNTWFGVGASNSTVFFLQLSQLVWGFLTLLFCLLLLFLWDFSFSKL